MSKRFKHSPPRWADWFLGLFCNPDLLEQLQGDVHELFYWRVEEKGYSHAKWSFIWDVIRLFRWSNIRRTRKQGQKLNQIGMFKNYFKIGVRNLWKQRMPSAINIIGLSIAVGCSIVAFKFVEFSYVKDNFHKNKEDLFLVTHWEELESNKGRNGAINNELTREILESVPGIKASTRYNRLQLEVRVNKHITYNLTHFVDPAYLEMFTFELQAGNPKTLNSADQVVIDESTAIRLFGEQSALDQSIELKIGEEWKVFSVGAVYKDKPHNGSLQLGILVNYQHFEQHLSKLGQDDWSTNFFIQRQAGTQPELLLESMDKLLPIYNKDNEDGAYSNFELEPITTMANNAYKMSNSIGSAPNKAPILTLSAIAVFMLLLSTLNYVNISLAMIMKRLKEIGVRKVVGSPRRQLIIQFLCENLLLCLLSMFVGLLLAQGLFLPGFNEIAGVSFQLNLLSHQNFLMFLAALLLFISLASGLYPAVVASSYRPISILRKATQRGGRRILSSVFLTFQMILAMVTIVAAVMFVYANQVNESIEWGYDQHNKLVIGIPESDYRDAFRDVLLADPSVEVIAGTRSNIGQSLNGVQFKNGEVKTYAELFEVGRNYPEVLGLKLVEGRLFDENLESDFRKMLIVNQSFLEDLQLTFDPDGTTVVQDSVEYSIIGVVEDYHYWNPGMEIRGAAMRAIPANLYTSYLVEMREGNIFEHRGRLEEKLQAMVEEKSVYVGVQELMFEGFYDETRGIGNIMIFTASIAILLAAMGLYGLVSINISSQIKDYGIRKVLGASSFNLAKAIVLKFRFVLLLAILVGCPLAVLLVGALVDNVYAYAPGIGVGPLAVAVFILLSVTLFTFNLQIRRVRNMNPAETLRTE
jgi:ABC-type antimicrobial peptide transport system permease subunit